MQDWRLCNLLESGISLLTLGIIIIIILILGIIIVFFLGIIIIVITIVFGIINDD